MTAVDLWLLVAGFAILLGLGTILVESTATGRAWADRIVDWVLR